MKHARGRYARWVAVVELLAVAWGYPAAADCKLSKLLDLPVTMVDMHPMLTLRINGMDAKFIADSGAFYSMMTPAGAAEFKLKTYPAPWGLRVNGMGGEAGGLAATMVKDLMVANLPVHNIEFLVGGGDVGGGGIGVVGQNVFRIGDVEYDLAHGVIRLMREDDCRKATLAYWATGSDAVSMIEIGDTTALEPHTTGVAFVNGVKIRVMFDTGAYGSLLTKTAAARAGIKLDSPGVVEVGESRGIGRNMVKTWIAPVASFKLGDEEIRNTKLRITDSEVGYAEMLIGADFFLSHRIYVASKLHRLFFTYNGGRVFSLASSPSQAPSPSQPPSPSQQPPQSQPPSPSQPSSQSPPSPSPAPSQSSMPSPAEGTDVPASPSPPGATATSVAAAAAAVDEPHDAAGFSRRGSAFAARRDYVHALADLGRACELAPDNSDYRYQRGETLLKAGQPGPALADFDRAIVLQPDHLPARLARAELRLRAGQGAEAAIDLDTVDRAADKQADVRLGMARDYLQAERLPSALAQLDLWIAAHRDDSRLPEAQLERCWVRALSGQDLPKALDDCNAAFKRLDKSTGTGARVLVSRGLVRLRLGDYDKALADFNESLARQPKDPWALYGRGVDEMRRGMTGQGQADMAAATALWAPIAEKYSSHGLMP